MPSAIEVTMFLPASLNLPKKFLTVLNAPVIPFLTAFLTLLNALVTIPLRPLKIEVKTDLMVFNTPFIMLCQAFVMLDIIFIIPDSKLRSEERRVGKEYRSSSSGDQYTNMKKCYSISSC